MAAFEIGVCVCIIILIIATIFIGLGGIEWTRVNIFKQQPTQILKKTDRPSVLATCPDEYVNNGTQCVKDAVKIPAPSKSAVCPTDFLNNGTRCVKPENSYSAPSILAECPAGYSNNGLLCINDQDSYVKGCSIIGGPQFPCKDGFTDMGCYCQRTLGIQTLPLDNAKCPAGYNRQGSRCYKICDAGYTNMGEMCKRPEDSNMNFVCPPGYFRKDAKCYKTCDMGFTNIGEFCEKPRDIKGPETMKCTAENPDLIGAKCYGACPKGTRADGAFCSNL